MGDQEVSLPDTWSVDSVIEVILILDAVLDQNFTSLDSQGSKKLLSEGSLLKKTGIT
jgi:hypothetical protein